MVQQDARLSYQYENSVSTVEAESMSPHLFDLLHKMNDII